MYLGNYVKETNEELEVKFLVLGLGKENVDISVVNNLIIVKFKQEDSFKIPLPLNVDIEKILTECSNGILTVTIPKSIKVSKQIEVK